LGPAVSCLRAQRDHPARAAVTGWYSRRCRRGGRVCGHRGGAAGQGCSKIAVMGQYSQSHPKEWASKVASCDGYIFVTPEHNHSISGALKNTIGFLYKERNNKALGSWLGPGPGRPARARNGRDQETRSAKVTVQ